MGRRSGFSVVETLVGASILTLLLLGANNIFQPVVKAARKAKLINSMMKVENLIREEVYTQLDYSDPNKFEIKNGNVVIAKHDTLMFVSEDLQASSLQPIYPIQTRLQLVDFDSGNKKAIVYQVTTATHEGVRVVPLGEPKWPSSSSEMDAYLTRVNSGDLGATNATVVIPPILYESTFQKCEDGFIRGISNGKKLICWNFVGDKQCPPWALPVGYKIDNAASTVELLCQMMNRIQCPKMTTVITPPTGPSRTIALDNFYSLNKLDKRDFFPPRPNGGTGVSECKSIIDFSAPNIADPSGVISAAVVAANSGKCPDKNMYALVAGKCVPTFVPASISAVSNAVISPNTAPIQTATQARAQGDSR